MNPLSEANLPNAGLLALCRIGFERECSEELQLMLNARGALGYAKFTKLTGLVIWLGSTPYWPATRELVFSRQVVTLQDKKPLVFAGKDRISPILAALEGQQFSAIYLDHADTPEGNTLSELFTRLQRPLLSAAGKAGILNRQAALRAHLVFMDGRSAWLGTSASGQTLNWPMGIPRLKLPAAAPSRSTLKLAEALAYFMDKSEQDQWLREGITAVDLGASPGGWTYALVQHGVQVTAIDNGPLNAHLLHSAQVEHIQADGYDYQPARPVHWLVCDLGQKPARDAQLVADWLARGDAKRAIFNLKLPASARLSELALCRELIEGTLAMTSKTLLKLQFRHLYHDRDEVTGYAVVD